MILQQQLAEQKTQAASSAAKIEALTREIEMLRVQEEKQRVKCDEMLEEKIRNMKGSEESKRQLVDQQREVELLKMELTLKKQKI